MTFFKIFDEADRADRAGVLADADETTGCDEPGIRPILPTDPNVIPADVPRLSKQCAAILELLRLGKRTNAELAEVSIKYTSRISDLRKAGFDVQCVERRANGITVYQLL